MDTKITKKRLNDHLSYDWVKYVAIIAATVFLFWMMYDMGAKKPNTAQSFEMYVLNATVVAKKEDKLNEDLMRAMRADDVVYDSRGNRVFYDDEALSVTLASYGNYSSDSQVQTAVQTKLMGGGESDVMVLDYNTFVNFTRTWLVSLDELLKDAQAAYESNWERVKSYPIEYADKTVDESGRVVVADVETARQVRERKFWQEIKTALDNLTREETLTKKEYDQLAEQNYPFAEEWSETLTLPCYQKYGYYTPLYNEEGLKKWQTYSEELQKALTDYGITSYDDVTPEKLAKYRELQADFDAKLRELGNDETYSKGYNFWGIDLCRLDLEKVKTGWVTTSEKKYLRQYGETEDSMYFAMGVSGFKEENGTAYYELVKVFDYVLTNFA